MCTALGEKGGFGDEATVSPGWPLDRRAGWVHLGPVLGSVNRGAGSRVLSLWLSLLRPHGPSWPLLSSRGLGGCCRHQPLRGQGHGDAEFGLFSADPQMCTGIRSRGCWLKLQTPGPHSPQGLRFRVGVPHSSPLFNQRCAPQGCQGPTEHSADTRLALTRAWLQGWGLWLLP